MGKRGVLSAAIGLALTLPFVGMELIHRPGLAEFPFVLFGFLWLLASVFAFVATALVRRERARPGVTLLHLAVLVLVAYVWGEVVLDQMPCFLGVPNCD